MAITTITPITKKQRTLGYTVDSSIVTYNRVQITWQCSTCNRGGCEHTQAVISLIKAERAERQAKDAEIARQFEGDRALREGAKSCPKGTLNGSSQGFSLMR